MIIPDGSPGTDRVAGSLFVGNDVAVHAGVRTVVEDNVFRRNGTGLLSQSAGTPFEVEDVTVQGNTLTRNGDGVVIDTVVARRGQHRDAQRRVRAVRAAGRRPRWQHGVAQRRGLRRGGLL